ncbi:hypothetical protein UlMin_000993 [Ulmus minor]
MEGRGISEFCRNPSEDLFLRSYMESATGMPVPTMDVLGFKNLSQNLRVDSEELFRSWLTNGENNGYSSPSIAHRTRPASRRISTELTNLSSQQHVTVLQNKKTNDNLFLQNNATDDDISGNLNHHSIRNSVEKGLQASDLYLAKAWFHSSQPMTRSRSSELRKRYVAMQNSHIPVGLEGLHNTSGIGDSTTIQEYVYPNGFNGASSMYETPNQLNTFMSPSNSSSSTFNNPPVAETDKVSSVVSMLKGTLERKKLNNLMDREVLEDDSCNGMFPTQEVMINTDFNQGQQNQVHEKHTNFQELSHFQVKNYGVIQRIEGSMDLELEGFVNPTNPIQTSRASQEPSQSESSAAAPVVSSGFDGCDGPSNSSQALSACGSSRKQPRKNAQNGSRAKDIRERIMDNLKDERKRGTLDRHGSINSAISGDKEDPTKKRRVERSRKMAEAKERNSSPAIPSDMQAVLKRCENLEKEVRSLKLNLSFMNRKDSEQTKQIEELQKQNEELQEEKECLIEEIKKIMSETGNL